MSAASQNSVGIVQPQVFRHEMPFSLHRGKSLPNFELVYETYGTLNTQASNAVLICHALSGHHHAAGYHHADDSKPGWWDACIGPGKPINTDKFFVVSLNNLGGCHGSTGPGSIDEETGLAYGAEFPRIVVKDWVASQALLADHLGIHKFAAIVGGSLGGMQALQWTIDFPERVHAAVIIAAAAKLSAQNIAFNEIARQAILSDPDQGLGLARMIGHVTYLSDDGMREKFGRELRSGDPNQGADVEFQVESYLHHQAKSFSQTFDADTYVLMTKALDYFDPATEAAAALEEVLANTTSRFLVMSFTSDWRFSQDRSQEIIDALIAARKNVASAVIESEHGHDSFLLPIDRYIAVFSTYLDRLHDQICQ
jgi:homoserine O-acetyltransferase